MNIANYGQLGQINFYFVAQVEFASGKMPLVLQRFFKKMQQI
ncbi:MAG: hypothetical protein ACTHMM_14785 [Agriterribacter sp.]